jgi:hypothetical protein
MRYRSIRRFVCIIVTAILAFIPGVAVTAYTAEYRSAKDILMHKAETEGYEDIQSFIDGWLTENAGSGSSEWYAMGISSSGDWDFSSYNSVIEEKLTESGLRATDYQRMALAYTYCGGYGVDIGEIIDSTWNQLGIMSEIFSLILLESGEYSYTVSESEIINSLISRQKTDGGWNLSGNYSDPDVTAMVLQSLAPFMDNPDVSEAAEKGIEVLSSMQQSDGGYKSYGTANSESCSQVIMALTQLGISPESDSRFIKNGNTVVDALMSYSSETGGFTHISGTSENGMATVQAYNAMVSIEYGGFYRVCKAIPELPVEITEEATAEVSEANEAAETTASEKNINKKTDEEKISSSRTEVSKDTEQHTEASPVKSEDNPQAEINTDTVSKENSAESAKSAEQSESAENFAGEQSESYEKNNVAGRIQESSKSSLQTSEASTTAVTSSASGSSVTSSTAKEVSTAVKASEEKISETESASAEMTVKEDNGSGIGWKIMIYAVIIVFFVFSQLYFISRKQFTWKRLILTAIVCGIISGAVHFINIQTPEEYYSRSISDISEDSLTVEFSVSCETIADELDGEYEIIPPTEIVLIKGETVFDILERVLAYNQIPFDYSGSGETIYIRGIDNIYEFDYGDMSGWMYRVNGEFPNVGCGAYYPEDGDVIEWLYTKNIGKDIGMEDEY